MMWFSFVTIDLSRFCIASGQSYGHQQLTADQHEQNTTDPREQQSADSAANMPVGRKHPYYGDVGVTCPYPTMCTLSLGKIKYYLVKVLIYSLVSMQKRSDKITCADFFQI